MIFPGFAWLPTILVVQVQHSVCVCVCVCVCSDKMVFNLDICRTASYWLTLLSTQVKLESYALKSIVTGKHADRVVGATSSEVFLLSSASSL